MPKKMISIIVSVYNLEKELPRCLDSILAQSYAPIEVVVIDDGSQDASREIILQYSRKDQRIRPVFQENSGVTSARLRGVSEAAGEWIGFVDGDDMIQSDMYSRLLNNAEKYDAEITHCGYQMVFPDGRVNYFHNTGALEIHDTKSALQELLSGRKVEPGLCNKLFHHSLFKELTIPGDIKINEDLLMNYVLFSRAERTVFEDWCPYLYMVRSASASRAGLNQHKIYDPIRVKQEILDMAVPGMELDARRAYVNTCVHVFNALMMEPAGAFCCDVEKVRQMICQRRDWIGLLRQKQRLLARLILCFPSGYRYLYRFYAKYVQKNPYI